MNSEDTCLNFLSEDSYVTIPTILLHFFKEDKDSIFILMHLVNQYKYLSKTNQLEPGGFFYSTVEALNDRYYINDYAQRKAIKNLEECGLITTTKRGMPAKRYFRINSSAIERVLKSSPTVFKKKINKEEFYNNFNTSIESGWNTFKSCIDNMGRENAFSCYTWKGFYDKKFGVSWKWNSLLVGIISQWTRNEIKSGNIDYSHFLDYFNTLTMNTNQEEVLKKFIIWFKAQPDKPIDRRLTDTTTIISMIEGA